MVLAVCATLAPSSTVKPTDLALVKLKNATSVDVSPDVVWILAVGSDARPGEDMTRVRGDALQLIGMNTKTGAAAAIGIPRDSYVSIPGVGSERINAALYYGGPELLGETVGELIGIVPDYVFVTRFEKFANMVNDIGGIEVDNPTYFSDTYLKPKGFEAGKQHLNGYLALAFSRIRKTLLRGDFDRSANQQRVLRGIQAKIRERAGVHGFIEKGVLSAMQNMATNASPCRALPAGQGRGRGEALADHHLRGAGRDRQHRRRQRRAAVRRPGPAVRRRGPRGRHPRVLRLTLTRQFWPFRCEPFGCVPRRQN